MYSAIQPGLNSVSNTELIQYRELGVAEPLSRYVDKLWYLDASRLGRRIIPYHVVADGCADIYFDCGGQAAPMLTYSASTPLTIGVPNVRILGARLLPGTVSLLTHHVHLRDLAGKSVPLLELLGERSPLIRFSKSLPSIRGIENTLSELGASLERSILASHGSGEPLLASSFSTLIASSLDMSRPHEALYQVRQVGERQGRRLLIEQTGLPPKRLARVVRFQRALAAIINSPQRTLADIAMDAGYFDQPHFTREANLLSGMTASQIKSLQVRNIQAK